MVLTALIALLLFVSSCIVFGVAVARMRGLPKLAGIGFAVSAVLFAVIGFALDNWIQSVASTLMVICSVWIAIAMSRSVPESPDEPSPNLAGSRSP